MQEIRAVDEIALGCSRKMLPPPVRSSVIAVAVHDEDAPVVLAPLTGVPLPRMEMPIPIGTVIPEVHVHDPAGILITSPSTATCVGPLMSAFTLVRLQSLAV
jgi:hypothetical protein